MEYRVAELADTAGVGVDTIRFYQARDLIPAPERRGRFAIYTTDHLERIRRIRELLDSGFSLAQIRKLLADDADAGGSSPSTRASGRDESLLDALAAQSVGVGTVTRSELAAETGVPEALIGSAVQAGLIAPSRRSKSRAKNAFRDPISKWSLPHSRFSEWECRWIDCSSWPRFMRRTLTNSSNRQSISSTTTYASRVQTTTKAYAVPSNGCCPRRPRSSHFISSEPSSLAHWPDCAAAEIRLRSRWRSRRPDLLDWRSNGAR